MAATKDPIYPNQVNPSKTGRWGEIDKFIPQSSPSYMDANGTENTLTQVFKGPITRLEDLQSFLDGMLKATSQTNKTLHYFMGNTNDIIQWGVGGYTGTTSMYTVMFPMGGEDKEWVIDSYTVEECNPAGLMCIFRVKFRKVKNEDGEDSEPDYTYWQCKMQSTQINVLAYCSNKPKQSGGGGSDPKPAGEDGGTYTTRIQTWWNQPTDTAWLKPQYKFQSVVGTNKIETLNKAEIEIAKYLERSENPNRHFPVIVKRQVYSGKPTVDFSEIDHIVTTIDINSHTKAGEACPFKNLGDWNWLCTGIDVEYNSTTKVSTVTTEYTGSATPWNNRFYGSENGQGVNKRWEFGEVYDESNNT